ncbi:MAG: hypothetical protein OXI59_22880 [Gemmatimonadota bacterium]|nr:hypothetical protein [Gemmatimonadota bacterium]
MAFIFSLIVGFGAFFLGQKIFRRMPPYPLIDSLRIGRAHYLLLGVLVGMFFSEADEVFHLFEVVRYNCIGAILLWIGLQTGLSTDLQNLRDRGGISVIYSQTAVVLATGGFTVLAAFASGLILYRYLGLLQNLPLAIVLLTCFALTVRFPTPFFQWPNRPIPTPVPGQNLPLSNIAAMAVLCIAFPPLAENPIFYLGNLPFIGATGIALLMLGAGVVGGIALDFSFRSHRTGARALGLVLGIVIALSGLCQAPDLPSLAVGFLSGIWLINTTVAKREIVEFTTHANDVIEPIFFALTGSIIGEFGGDIFFLWSPLFPLALTVILVRGMGRTIGFTISQTLWQIPQTWRELLTMSWRPQGTLSIAVGVQAIYLLDFQHYTLITGLVIAVFLSQMILIPPANSPQSHT